MNLATASNARDYLTFTVFSWGYAIGMAAAFFVGYVVSRTMLPTLRSTVIILIACLIGIVLAVTVLHTEFVFWVRLTADVLGAFSLAIFANVLTLLKERRRQD